MCSPQLKSQIAAARDIIPTAGVIPIGGIALSTLPVGNLLSTAPGARALAPTAVISSFPSAATGSGEESSMPLSRSGAVPPVAARPMGTGSIAASLSSAMGAREGTVKNPVDGGSPRDVASAVIRDRPARLTAGAGVNGRAPHDDILHMPTPKPRPIFDGTEEWGTARDTRTSDDDDNYRDKQLLVRKGRAVGYNHAADFLSHFLDNAGADMRVDPRVMLKEIPAFNGRNTDDYRQNILDVALRAIKQNYRGQAIKIVIPGRWNAAAAEGGDWYYALHQFDFANAAVVRVTPATNGKVDISVDGKLYVYDKYNWDPNKQARVGYFGIDDEEMARLHHVGLAREYEVKGEMRYSRRVWRSVDPMRPTLPLP